MLNDITRRSFVAGALAASALSTNAQAPETELQRKVLALPASTAAERRKKAMLLWAAEDVSAARAANMEDDAAALTADILAAIPKPLGNPASLKKGLFPKIETRSGNPWLDKTGQKIRTLLAAAQHYPRGSNPDSKQLGIKAGYPYIQLGQEGSMLAQALGNPETDLYGDPALIAPILRRFAASFEILTPGSKHLADFGVTPHISEMYCLLKSAFPDLILPSRQKAWESALTLNCEAILKAPGQVFSEPGMPTQIFEQMIEHPGPGDCYPNAQSHLMMGLLFTGLAIGNERFVAAAAKCVPLMATAFYPDGATAYINQQNECFTYHGIMIEDLTRYWQVTGERSALDLVLSSRWYYPLSITPQGVAEYSSAPCWKHYWNAIKGTSTASILASLMHCEYNAAVAANDGPSALWLAATVYVPVKPRAWWDNEMFYDRNIEGPRGRFGQYSFCGTARNTLQDKRPKLTYVGNLWVEPNDRGQRQHNNWPINAGLDAAFGEVRLNTKPETVNRWDTHACLAHTEQTASLANEHFGAVASSYLLSQYGQPPIRVAGRQQWLLTPQRLAGLLELESLEDQDLFSMAVTLKTVSGRDTSGIRKEWKPKGPGIFEYGALTIRLWPLNDAATDLFACGTQLTGYTDTYSGNSQKCGILTLIDPASSRSQQKIKSRYTAGTRFRAAVEIFPTAFGGASSLRLIPTDQGLVGLELAEPGQTLQIIHNISASDAIYRNPTRNATLHGTGEKHRAAFLPACESLAPARAQVECPIRAGELIVLRSVSPPAARLL